jgi:cyclic beta-1,2-glucan synthetase
MGQGEKAEALFRLINPVLRADTKEKAALYKVEPYVISADVYSISPHEGRGGWTWYTGSSGWMYRLGIEGILGIRRQGDYLQIRPRVPAAWPAFKVIYTVGRTPYHITIKNPQEQGTRLWLDGELLPESQVPLEDDGQVHEVKNFW